MARRLALGRSLREAVAFLPRAWAGAWAALVAFSLALALPTLLNKPALPTDIMGASCLLAIAATGLVMQGALYRLGVSHSFRDARALGLGLGGIQLGWAELRLLTSGMQVSGFLALVALCVALVGVFIAGALGATSALWRTPHALTVEAYAGHGDAIVASLIWMAGAIIVAQLAIRLSLYKPACVARRKHVSLDALALSEGAFWKILLGLAMTLLPTAALVAFALRGRGFQPLGPHAVSLPVVLIIVLLQAPLSIGFLSSAYRQLEYRKA